LHSTKQAGKPADLGRTSNRIRRPRIRPAPSLQLLYSNAQAAVV